MNTKTKCNQPKGLHHVGEPSIETKTVLVHPSYGRRTTVSVYVRRNDGPVMWAYDTYPWAGEVESVLQSIITEEWDYHVQHYGGEPAYIVIEGGVLRIVAGKGRMIPFLQVGD